MSAETIPRQHLMPVSPERKLTLAASESLGAPRIELRAVPGRQGVLVRRRVRRFGLIADLQAQ